MKIEGVTLLCLFGLEFWVDWKRWAKSRVFWLAIGCLCQSPYLPCSCLHLTWWNQKGESRRAVNARSHNFVWLAFSKTHVLMYLDCTVSSTSINIFKGWPTKEKKVLWFCPICFFRVCKKDLEGLKYFSAWKLILLERTETFNLLVFVVRLQWFRNGLGV